MDQDPELINTDPQSEETFKPLAALIGEELFARIAVRDRLETVGDANLVGELIADSVLDRFVVRPRPSDQPRVSWARSEST